MSGAGCSRVTHPFAARVPRRAFPLDLHVLSTPPAFVLSQDQTLQQKPWKIINPATNNLLPKTQPRPQNHAGKIRPQTKLGTGLSSTLLSSQRTTTHQKPTTQPGDSAPGHSFNFTGSFRDCQPVLPGSYPSNPVRPATWARGDATRFGVRTGRTAAAVT